MIVKNVKLIPSFVQDTVICLVLGGGVIGKVVYVLLSGLVIVIELGHQKEIAEYQCNNQNTCISSLMF